FDAIAYGVSVNHEGEINPDEPTPPPVELEQSISDINDNINNETHQDAQDDELIQDDPDADQEDQERSIISDEFSTSFLELDDSKPADPYKTEVDESSEQSTKEDESWTQNILDELEEDSPRKEPHFGDELEEPEESFIAAEPEQYTNEFSKPAEEPAHFFYEQEQEKKGHWLLRGLLTLVCLALVLVLIAQASWFHYEKFAKYPHFVTVMSKACEWLKCELPELSDISKISSQNLVVRSHPTARQALIIDTVIVNEADFAQDFPDIALYFSDINNNIVAQRRIKPEEYLTPDILSWNEMPPEKAIHISLELMDPGKEAVNYELRFFPREKRTNNSQLQNN
ncbi:MAG: DUF3426 domain-containing protein, partial [Oleiphilaceae bacterium]|nr:DUF3426 domain-containing protein [Oleiphilaceae bacterium]